MVFRYQATKPIKIITKAIDAFKYWRTIPSPKRGELVRKIGDELLKRKEFLGKLVSYEMGKMETIHPQSWDIPVDWVVTERGVYRRDADGSTFLGE